MFPIIPLHLRTALDAFHSPRLPHFTASVGHAHQSSGVRPSKASPSGAGHDTLPLSGVASWETAGRVLAGEELASGVVSEEFPAEKLLGERRAGETRRVLLSPGGRLSGSSWARDVRLSADCHGCNLMLQRGVQDTTRLRLQVIRPLRPGEELRLWFAQPTLAALSVPFLRPDNIHGDNRYVCHRCRQAFETPNPLKLHLALGCRPIDLNTLYARLHAPHGQIKPEPGASPAPTPEPREQDRRARVRPRVKLEPDERSEPVVAMSRCLDVRSLLVAAGHVGVAVGRSPSDAPDAPDASKAATGSAFRPYWRASAAVATSPSEHAQVGGFVPLGTSYFRHATEMETLVSNLGRSKQGHLCVYCGKVYSRKYGLKIHIRTHTGFKPLQCKHCLRPFGDPSNLNKHVRLHAEGSTPYKCDLCGKILVRRRDLERHIKSRHSLLDADHVDS